ncbi:SGNH/GDSL hydrolase family protein [Brevundimonas naejangsanensis]|uniref:SGNH/GDSL hydrolase family protein n=1 Tax=Brevundimonas naejangsanensis TaxID=588932 RepID=UPI00106A8DC6|nr:GDSL-type esterase/lipase family protein [Brevundimonas naejangsanensis]QBQ49101.1 hypothetical protein E3U41_10635 [Brevundimonas naejangsanensis]
MRLRFIIWLAVIGFAFSAGVIAKPTLARLRNGNPADHPSHQMRLDQFKRLTGDAGRVVMLGDSHIQNGEWAEWLQLDVANRGIGQNTTVDVLNRLDSVPASDVVVLLIGSNDLKAGEEPARTAARTAEIVAALDRRVILLSVPPRNDADPAPFSQLNALNEKHCRGGACRYLDVNRALLERGRLPASLTLDGVHLNGEGYRRIADALRPALKTLQTDAPENHAAEYRPG